MLTEMRSVLGVLRAVDEVAPRVPAPSLARLDELVARSSDAGLSTCTQNALTVQVNNQTADAGTPGVEGTGNGIAGMRERVTALGGEFSAGPLPGSREFRVRASFPLETGPMDGSR